MTSATVTTPDGAHEKVAVVINTATSTIRLTRGTKVVATKAGVVTNERGARGLRVTTHTVTFADGDVWQIEKTRGGCKPCGR